MSVSEIFVFCNPISGRGQGPAIASRMAAALKHARRKVRLFDSPAGQLTNGDLSGEARAMIVIGGDGTLRGVVERAITLANGQVDQVPPVLFVPLGTANLMSQHLQLAWESRIIEKQLLGALEKAPMVSLDVARAGERIFLLMAGVGIDAAIIHELDRARSGPIDLTSYAIPSLLALQKYEYPALRVEVDGCCVHQAEPAMAFVGNVPEYGTGFPILTKARATDGLLDVCVLPCRSRRQVIRLLMAAATGDHVNQEGVIYVQGKTVRIESPVSAPLQLDGEAAGHTPIDIDLLPSRLRFIVPRET